MVDILTQWDYFAHVNTLLTYAGDAGGHNAFIYGEVRALSSYCRGQPCWGGKFHQSDNPLGANCMKADRWLLQADTDDEAEQIHATPNLLLTPPNHGKVLESFKISLAILPSSVVFRS